MTEHWHEFFVMVGGDAAALAGFTGAFMICAFGLHVAAIAMIVFFALMISGAWLLVVGAHESRM